MGNINWSLVKYFIMYHETSIHLPLQLLRAVHVLYAFVCAFNIIQGY